MSRSQSGTWEYVMLHEMLHVMLHINVMQCFYYSDKDKIHIHVRNCKM